MVGFGKAYRVAERRLMRAVCERFGLDPEEPKEVKTLDSRVLENEALELMPPIPGRKTWTGHRPVPDVEIRCWSPRRAEAQFLRRYELLTGGRTL
jgi:hypothetical protein